MDEFTSLVHIWTLRLRAIATIGLAFDPEIYDRERYEELLALAAEMAATNGHAEIDRQALDRLYEKWRAEVRPGMAGYVTPRVGVGAIVFNAQDELLLIQRPSGVWHYPTGWADIGYSPAQVAIKEVAEETGLAVTPLRLIAVYNLVRSFEPPVDHLYSLVFYCRLDGGELKRHPAETQDIGFFPRDRLPSPLGRQDLPWVEHAWAARRGELIETYFDGP